MANEMNIKPITTETNEVVLRIHGDFHLHVPADEKKEGENLSVREALGIYSPGLPQIKDTEPSFRVSAVCLIRQEYLEALAKEASEAAKAKRAPKYIPCPCDECKYRMDRSKLPELWVCSAGQYKMQTTAKAGAEVTLADLVPTTEEEGGQ